MVRSTDEIINDAISFIDARSPGISTLIGTVTRDVVIDSPSQEMGSLYNELDRISRLQSVDFPTAQTETELELLASNYGLTRGAGTFAQGTVTFRTINFTTGSADIIIPAGTLISSPQTSTTDIAIFQTNEAATFVAVNAPTFFNNLTSFYELTVPITSQSIGESANLSAGAITVLNDTINNIFSVINTVSTTAGTDLESNIDLAARIQAKLSGNNIGTVNGITSLTLEDSNVSSLAVVGPDDPEMERNEFGGSVDVYVVGSVTTSATDTPTFTTAGSRLFVLEHQPANTTSSTITVNGIVSNPTPSTYTFVEGVDYTIEVDPSTLFAGSTQVQHAIKLLDAGTLPDDSTVFNITYSYNQLIETLQATFDSQENHIVASDLVLKEALPAEIDVEADITVLSGFTSADVVAAGASALTEFLTTGLVGQSFNRSDIVGVLEGTEGVDSVDLGSLGVSKNAIAIITQQITILKTETAIANLITITAT